MPNTTYFQEVNSSFNAAIAAKSANTVFVYIEAFAFREFAGPRYSELPQNFLREKYRDQPIGVIVAYNPLALAHAVQWRDEAWPGVPVIFTGVNDKFAASLKLPPNVTGFTVRHRLQDAVDIARKLVPSLKQIVLIGDRLGTKGYWQFFPEEIPQIAKHLTVVDLTSQPMAEVKQRVATLPANAAIVYLAIFKDGAGRNFIPSVALRQIAEVANRPIIVDTETFLGYGGIGGAAPSLKRIGEDAAELAWRVINGADVSKIPIRNANVIRPIFDWRQLQRFGIDESSLPASSEIRFRPPTAWDQYRWQIVLAAIALLGQSLLMAGLIQQRRRRQQAEIEIRQRTAELASMNRRVVAGQMSASIAHEVNQPLTAILANAEALQELLGQANLNLHKIQSIVTDIISEDTRASEVVDRLRQFLRRNETRSEIVGLNELVDSTLHLMRGDIVKRKVRIKTNLAINLPPIPGDPVQLQQVLINLLINAMDAVGSKRPSRRIVKIATRANGKYIGAEIVDFGLGISAQDQQRLFEPFFTTKEHGLGLGLSICAAIVREHRGTLDLKNSAHGGATATLKFLPAHATKLRVSRRQR